jgi:hypothetical protein
MSEDRARARNETENEAAEDVEAHRFVSDEPGEEDTEEARARARARARTKAPGDELDDEHGRART